MSSRSGGRGTPQATSGSEATAPLWTKRTVVFIGLVFAAGVAASPTQALLAAYVDGFLRQPPRLTAAVNAIKMACSAIFALVGGVVADRVGRRAALVIGLILAISGAFLLVAETPWHLLALAVIAGTSAGFVSTGGQSYLLAVSPAQRLGTATAAYFLGRTASQALGAYAAGLAAAFAGFHAVGLTSGGLLLVVALAALRWLPREPVVQRKPAPAQAGWRRWDIAGYSRLLRRADVLALGAIRYFPTTAWGTASLMFPLLVYRLTQSEATVGLYGTVSLVAATAAQLATGRAVDRVGARVLVVPLCVGILLCAILAAVLHTATLGLFRYRHPLVHDRLGPLHDGPAAHAPARSRGGRRPGGGADAHALEHGDAQWHDRCRRADRADATGAVSVRKRLPRPDVHLGRLVLAPHRDAGADIGRPGLTPGPSPPYGEGSAVIPSFQLVPGVGVWRNCTIRSGVL